MAVKNNSKNIVSLWAFGQITIKNYSKNIDFIKVNHKSGDLEVYFQFESFGNELITLFVTFMFDSFITSKTSVLIFSFQLWFKIT